MADLDPITRQEKIIAGEDIQPVTRLEHFLKNYGGGASLYEHRLTLYGKDQNAPTTQIEAYLNVITASETPITNGTTLFDIISGVNVDYVCSGMVVDMSDTAAPPKQYFITRLNLQNTSVMGTVIKSMAVFYMKPSEMTIYEQQTSSFNIEQVFVSDTVRQIC